MRRRFTENEKNEEIFTRRKREKRREKVTDTARRGKRAGRNFFEKSLTLRRKGAKDVEKEGEKVEKVTDPAARTAG